MKIACSFTALSGGPATKRTITAPRSTNECLLTLAACAKGYNSWCVCVCVCVCDRNNLPRLLASASDSAYQKYGFRCVAFAKTYESLIIARNIFQDVFVETGRTGG